MYKKIFGIDTLYFFCESNEYYDDLYLEILDQMEDLKGKFDKKEILYENKDIHIVINNISLDYLGKAEGFDWFRDMNEYFKIGFKDKYKNRGLNDIRVQFQANGIYSIGIYSLLNLIREALLKGYISNDLYITRADLNCFIQADLGFINKEMFVTRKRTFSTISEISDLKATQTLYIGKDPFKLRIYNKKEELKKSKKKDLMNEYFLNNGFKLDEPIFNIEFEMRRSHLRAYNIQSVEQLLSNAQKLFYNAMNDIRLIDLNKVSKKLIKNNKYQAHTHELWKEVQNEYTLDGFLQSSLPLQRLKRKLSIYDDSKFEYEIIAILRRAFMNNLNIDIDYLEKLFLKAKESLKKTTTNKHIKKDYIDVDIVDLNNRIKKLRLLDDGTLIEQVSTVSVNKLNDVDLMYYMETIRKTQFESLKNKQMYDVALKEVLKRELMPDISPHEADE